VNAYRYAYRSFLHVLGLYFFTKGFLLTRLVLDHKSECSVSPIAESKAPGSSTSGCWDTKSFDKAVIVVIDALRYDFTIPVHSKEHHYQNALPVLYETARQSPNNAILLPFIADPPTTTLQRLKGLTTGTLPTFIDAGSNFAGTAIEEDNLISQLRDNGKKLVHLGDDTWHALFPGHFDANLTHAYDSFNVWDLHTVDNGVSEHIFPLLAPTNQSKWDVLIGHYLGVDHAGHRYGPDHPAMTAKLQQMNGIIENLMKAIDENTLLVVFGDHGMDAKGDHGGESDDEVEAALFMYSKKDTFGRTHADKKIPPKDAKTRPIASIDLVPTLSLLLGMPIPFNNLGAPIEEAFAGKSGVDWGKLMNAQLITGAQIKRYQHEYTLARGLDSSAISTQLELWAEAEGKVLASEKLAGKAGNEARENAYYALSRYQQETLAVCKSLWARFDVPSMIQGITILVGSVTVLLLYSSGLLHDRSEVTPLLLGRVAIGTLIGAGLGIALTTVTPVMSMLDGGLFGSGVGGVLGVAIASLSIKQRIAVPIPASGWAILALVFTVFQAIMFASNSYTIWEDDILLYFLITFGVIALISSFRLERIIDRTLGVYHSAVFIVLTRVASFSRLCREEQMPYCRSTYYASANSSTSAPWQLLIPLLVSIVLPSIIKSFYAGTKSYHFTSKMWISYGLRAGLALAAVFWTIDAADDAEWFPDLAVNHPNFLKFVRTYISQFILALALAAGTTMFAWSPPLVSISTVTKTGFVESRPGAMATMQQTNQVTVLGYANVHGSRYALLVMNWYLALVLLQKPMGNGALSILCWQIFSLLEIIDVNSLAESPIGPVILGVMGSYTFFKTGHQAVLSAIQWESAFIPLHTIQYPWTPLLVAGNSFGAQILTAVAVPLVALWKRDLKAPGLLGAVAGVTATFLLYHTTIALATSMWAGWLRRHLMLYRIFSPRFMTAGIVLLVVDLIAVLVGVGGVRWSAGSVGEVFDVWDF
jgi:GPI ethanolamine phosphate transferase 3 subunit O